MAQIQFERVTKVFPEGTVAVRELDLTVEDGTLMVLVGPSGCGKTTALRMVAGLEEITYGQVRIGERVVNEIAPKDRDVAMVFQNYALYPHLSVFENMAFSLKLRRMKKPVIKARVGEAANMLALYDMLTRKPAQLSGGQRQRVAMGRAIVREPVAFLMDEPLSNLDAKLRVQMRTDISRLQRDVGVTTIYVTHDQIEAMTMGDKVAVLRLGVLQQVDEPARLYRHPANLFVAGFIGSPAMNMVEATIVSRDGAMLAEFGQTSLQITDAALAERPVLKSYSGRRVIVGIRPEDMEDAALRPDAPETQRLRTAVDLREDMGSEVLIHFAVDAPPVVTEDTKELLADRGEDVEEVAEARHARFVARFDADTKANEGERVEVFVDTRMLHFFDPVSGFSLWDRPPPDAIAVSGEPSSAGQGGAKEPGA